MKKRITALIISPIVGAILGYLLANAMNNGWFSSKWQMIEKPPVDVHLLVAISRDSLWVQSDSGTFYYNENSSICKLGCWIEVQEIPNLPIVEPYEARVTSEACASSPPLSRVIAKISECRIEMWVCRSFTFALRDDGTIYLWQADINKDYANAGLFFGICIGSIALFIPTLLFVLFLRLLDWLSNRVNKKSERDLTH